MRPVAAPLSLVLARMSLRRFFWQAGGQAATRGIVSESCPAQEQCPFAALGLDRGASAEELRARYLELAKRFHPDAKAGEADSKSNAFVDIRKAYEKALELQQRSAGIQSHDGPPSFWKVSVWPASQVKMHKAAETKRREWEKDQEALRAFWTGQDAQPNLQQRDAAYASAMARLLENRLRVENMKRPVRSTVAWPPDGTVSAGVPEAPSAAQWEQELEREMRIFGLENNRRRRCNTWLAFFRGGNPYKPRLWTSRKRRIRYRTIFKLAVLAVVTMFALAEAVNAAAKVSDAERRKRNA